MSKFSYFAERKLYFKLSFDNISENSGPLFSQINFDHTYFGVFCPGDFWHGGFMSGGFARGLCPGTKSNINGSSIQVWPKYKNMLTYHILFRRTRLHSHYHHRISIACKYIYRFHR